MNPKFKLLAVAVLAGASILSAGAQTEANHSPLGAEKTINNYLNIEVKNLQDQSLGRVVDLGIDLINGRIVEVLVKTDSSLDAGGKIVAVPPLGLVPDGAHQIYRLNVSAEVFKTATAIDLKKWRDSGRSDRVAATYHLFGQDPYFSVEGDPVIAANGEVKVSLGYVERVSKVLDMPVGNSQGDEFGAVMTLNLNIPRGRILSVIILAPGNSKTKSIVPAMALSFNPARDALILDDTKVEFADEPRYILTEAAYGQKAYSKEESYKGPHTSGPLEQGSSYRDVGRTVRIDRDIRLARINFRHVEIGTINGRVTLRGWVYTGDDKRRIGELAVKDSRLELVDNQITVGKPVTVD